MIPLHAVQRGYPVRLNTDSILSRKSIRCIACNSRSLRLRVILCCAHSKFCIGTCKQYRLLQGYKLSNLTSRRKALPNKRNVIYFFLYLVTNKTFQKSHGLDFHILAEMPNVILVRNIIFMFIIYISVYIPTQCFHTSNLSAFLKSTIFRPSSSCCLF